MINIIETEMAPQAIGPYSQATCAGDFVFVSGQLPVDSVAGTVINDDVAAQAVQVFENIKAILKTVNCGLVDVVKADVYLKSMDDFTAVNKVYAEYFKGEILPARVAVEVARLPKDVKIEVAVIAYCKEE